MSRWKPSRDLLALVCSESNGASFACSGRLHGHYQNALSGKLSKETIDAADDAARK
jgi:hypothetical protein